MENLSQIGRPTWAEIDLDRLGGNFRSIRDFLGRGVAIMSVVKADAYGHGAVECGLRLEAEGSEWFAVATLEEGIELRNAGIARPILVLGGVWSGQETIFIESRLTPAIFTLEQALRLNEEAARTGARVNIHVKIDTGMNRVGFRAADAPAVAAELAGLGSLNVEGLMTHFAAADSLEDSEFTAGQIASFDKVVETFRELGHDPRYLDLANSPGAIVHPESRATMARIGGLLYGIAEDILPRSIDRPLLKAVMTISTRIAMIKRVPIGESVGYSRTCVTKRDSLIATLPIGYNDGLDRGLSNNGEVIVHGIKAPILGRISMDWTTIDITDIPAAKVGDKVTVLGSDGECSVTAEDIARKIDTISYEVTCGIAHRVPRIYQ